MEPSRPFATISIDVDPIDLHLEGYGCTGPRDSKVYESAVPRLIELFGRVGVRTTFFFVARDLPEQRAAVAAVAKSGHEVASHSVSHPIPFRRRLGRDAFAREIGESKRRLEDAAGAAVAGFRAPNWDLTQKELWHLAEAGYAYDASSYPSPFLLAARLLLAWKGGVPRVLWQLTKTPVSWDRAPRRMRNGSREIVEFPISTAGLWRFPLYQTTFYDFDDVKIAKLLDGAAARDEPFIFVLHAIDCLGLAEDGVDPRLARHPGMRLPLATKLASLTSTITAIAKRFDTMPFRDAMQRVE
jgi:hypothetical protein